MGKGRLVEFGKGNLYMVGPDGKEKLIGTDARLYIGDRMATTRQFEERIIQRNLDRSIKRAERDLLWLNWHINRGRLAYNARGPEIRRYMRQVSWRRAH